MMYLFFGFLAAAAGIYSLLIFIRIILSWFGGSISGKPVDLLINVTDPYLDWWRRNLNLRIGFIDLSVIAAIAFLSMVQNICTNLAYYSRITIGIILSLVVGAIWSVAAFILGFFFAIIILRMIAYLTNRNMYHPFWRVIDSISQPLLYRINRTIFGKRITGYLNGLIISSLLLAAILIGGGIAVRYFTKFLSGLPG